MMLKKGFNCTFSYILFLSYFLTFKKFLVIVFFFIYLCTCIFYFIFFNNFFGGLDNLTLTHHFHKWQPPLFGSLITSIFYRKL